MASKVDTWVVDDCVLFREGLLRGLSETCFHVTRQAGDLDEVAKILETEASPKLLVVSYRDDALPDLDVIRTVRDLAPDMKMATLVRQTSTGMVARAFESGIDGIVSSSISFDALIETLSMILQGEKVLRGGTEQFLAASHGEGLDDRKAFEGSGSLTKREVQFLEGLVRGEPNKVIAKRLGITEATAKVHMKRLFRKTKAANRTQAAIWAVRHGITLSDNTN